MKYCNNRRIREKVYRAFVARASCAQYDNTEIINELLQLRQEKASLLGLKTYAELSLATKMAESVEKVEELIYTMRDKCFTVAEKELAKLREYAAEHGATYPLELWDVGYWSEKQKEDLYTFTDEDVKPYFPLPKVNRNN